MAKSGNKFIDDHFIIASVPPISQKPKMQTYELMIIESRQAINPNNGMPYIQMSTVHEAPRDQMKALNIDNLRKNLIAKIDWRLKAVYPTTVHVWKSPVTKSHSEIGYMSPEKIGGKWVFVWSKISYEGGYHTTKYIVDRKTGGLGKAL